MNEKKENCNMWETSFAHDDGDDFENLLNLHKNGSNELSRQLLISNVFISMANVLKLLIEAMEIDTGWKHPTRVSCGVRKSLNSVTSREPSSQFNFFALLNKVQEILSLLDK